MVRLRPPSELRPGECYAALADGRFERRRLAPYGGAGAQPEGNPAPRRDLDKAPGPRPSGKGAEVKE